MSSGTGAHGNIADDMETKNFNPTSVSPTVYVGEKERKREGRSEGERKRDRESENLIYPLAHL